MSTSNLLNLLHLSDSAFPIGSHAHSYGLETLVAQGDVTNAADLCDLLRAHLGAVLASTDLVALRYSYELAGTGDLVGLVDLDTKVSALKPIREWREASLAAGRRLLTTTRRFVESPPPAPGGDEESVRATPFWEGLAERFGAGRVGPHHALAYGVVGDILDIDVDDLTRAYAFGMVATAVSAAVRLIPLGQMAAQQVLHTLKSDIEGAVEASTTHPRSDMGGSLPLLDIAGMRHEYADARLFMS